jgi:hypothetical protein
MKALKLNLEMIFNRFYWHSRGEKRRGVKGALVYLSRIKNV